MEPEDDGIILQTKMNNAFEQTSYSKVYNRNENLLKSPFPAPQEYNFDLTKLYVPSNEGDSPLHGLKVSPTHFHAFFRIAVAYHSYGAPAPKVEDTMQLLTRHFGIVSHWAVTPALMNVNFGDPFDMFTHSHFVRTSQSLGSICRLEKVEELVVDILLEKIKLDDVETILGEIERMDSYNFYIKMLASIGMAGGATVAFYGGGTKELMVAIFLGFMCHICRHLCGKVPFFNVTSEFWTALMAAFLMSIINITFDFSVSDNEITLPLNSTSIICFAPPIMGALIWDLPGLGISMAMRELVTGHAISGMSRLARSLVVSLSIAYGLIFGTHFLAFWNNPLRPSSSLLLSCNNGYLGYWTYIGFPPFILGTFFLLDAKLRHLPGIFFVSLIGLFTANFLSNYSPKFQSDIVSVLASFLVGIIGKVISRFTNHTSVVYVFSAILILLPGGMSVKFIYGMLDGHNYTSGGMNFGIQVIIIAFALSMGCLLAQLVPIPSIGKSRLMEKVGLIQSW